MNNCTVENTVSFDRNSTLCSCHRAYYGDLCQFKYDWFSPVLITIHTFQYLIIVLAFIWNIIKLKKMYNNNKLKYNLSFVAIIMNLLACTVRFIYLSLPSRSAYGSIETPNITLFAVFTVYFSISLWASTTLLTSGFWVDVLNKTMKIKISMMTKLFVIIFSVAIFVFTFCGMLIILFGFVMYGSIILLVPLIILCIVILIYIIKLKNNKANLSRNNTLKKNWVIKVFISINILWICYVIVLALTPFVINLNDGIYSIVLSVLYRLIECGIIISLCLLFDNNMTSIISIFYKDYMTSTKNSTERSSHNSEKTPQNNTVDDSIITESTINEMVPVNVENDI